MLLYQSIPWMRYVVFSRSICGPHECHLPSPKIVLKLLTSSWESFYNKRDQRYRRVKHENVLNTSYTTDGSLYSIIRHIKITEESSMNTWKMYSIQWIAVRIINIVQNTIVLSWLLKKDRNRAWSVCPTYILIKLPHH